MAMLTGSNRLQRPLHVAERCAAAVHWLRNVGNPCPRGKERSAKSGRKTPPYFFSLLEVLWSSDSEHAFCRRAPVDVDSAGALAAGAAGEGSHGVDVASGKMLSRGQRRRALLLSVSAPAPRLAEHPIRHPTYHLSQSKCGQLSWVRLRGRPLGDAVSAGGRGGAGAAAVPASKADGAVRAPPDSAVRAAGPRGFQRAPPPAAAAAAAAAAGATGGLRWSGDKDRLQHAVSRHMKKITIGPRND